MSTKLFLLLCVMVFAVGTITTAASTVLTDRPVIGILAQPIDMEGKPAAYPNRQYIAASYIKYIETAGGRVVPISWTSTRAEIEALLPQLNGVLLTGGDATYEDVVDFIFDVAIQLNKKGTYFPVWATCQGMQFSGIYFAHDRNLLGNYEVYDKALPLDIVKDGASKSLWWNTMPEQMKQNIATTPITMNFHHFGIGMESFHAKLASEWNLISTNIDNKGVEHVTSMEHKVYPFYAVQWHPEKNNFEFAVNDLGQSRHTTPHTVESIELAQYCANFFVHQCRMSGNGFTNWKELQAKLIYNFSPQRGVPSGFVENYFFDHWY